MKKHSAGKLAGLVAFFAGLLLGAAAANLCGDTYLKEGGLFRPENLSVLKTAAPDADVFFFWLLARRGKTLVLLWLFGYTLFALPVLLLFFLWAGFAAGLFLSLALLSMRLSGLLFFLAAILPQAFLYVPAIWIAAGAVWKKGKRRFTGRRIWQEDAGEKGYVRAFLLAAALLFIGLALESAANPWLLRNAAAYLLP